MPWSDDVIVQLQREGVAIEDLVDITQRQDPTFAAELRQREWSAAVERGRALLMAHLDDGQRASFEARHEFEVTGSLGGRYCIHLGREGNVWPLNERGRHMNAVCVHVRDRVPDEDNVLAQALMIEGNEADFRRLARLP